MLFYCYQPFPFYSEHNCRVVVIGAGIAGLTAARQLQSAGMSVTVIEARVSINQCVVTFKSP